MGDLALPPSDVADNRDTTRRLDQLARNQQLTPTTLPAVVVGGTPRADGYQTVDATAPTDIYRCDSYITARYLWYDLQLTSVYGTVPTSIDWLVYATYPYNGDLPTPSILASGSGGDGDEVAGAVDLYTAVSRLVLTEYAAIRVAVSRTGGAGEAAGIRLVAPLVLRNVG